jgi:hypothetical protein
VNPMQRIPLLLTWPQASSLTVYAAAFIPAAV